MREPYRSRRSRAASGGSRSVRARPEAAAPAEIGEDVQVIENGGDGEAERSQNESDEPDGIVAVVDVLPEVPEHFPVEPPAFIDLHEALGADGHHALESAPALAMPYWCVTDSQVKLRGTDELIGRVKMMRTGLPTEAVSVYCRRHGSTPPLRRTHQSPTIESLLGWFASGPKDRQTQQRHMFAF